MTLTPQSPSHDPGLPTSFESLLRHDAAALEAILRTDDLSPANGRWNPFLPFLAWLISTLDPALTVDLGFEIDATFPATWRAAQHTESPSRCVVVLLAEPGQSEQERASLVREFDDLIAQSAIRSDGALEGTVEEVGGALEGDDLLGEGFPPIHLLHAGLRGGDAHEPRYLEKWMNRLAPGGVIVVPNTESAESAEFAAIHRYVADRLPATVVSIGPSADVLVAQVPIANATPLIDHLRSAPPAFRGLFALFAERSEFRHVLGPEPVPPTAVRALIESLTERRRVEKETFQIALRASRETMATLATESGMLRAELAETKERAAREKADMQDEYFGRLDELSAKLSTSAAHYTRELTDRELALAAQERESLRLAGEAAEAQRKLDELLHTSSWRITAPVRLLSRVLGSGRARNAASGRN